MSEIEKMFSEIIESSEINKREFLIDKVKNGKQNFKFENSVD